MRLVLGEDREWRTKEVRSVEWFGERVYSGLVLLRLLSASDLDPIATLLPSTHRIKEQLVSSHAVAMLCYDMLCYAAAPRFAR